MKLLTLPSMNLSSRLVAVPTSTKISPAHYRLRIAATEADVRAAQLLRFIVFNLELREGLDESFDTCLDTDRFDAACEHLVVEEISTGEIVGTYRLQTGMRARECHGYYSEQEFDFQPYELLRSELLELGRACIHSGHRKPPIWHSARRSAVRRRSTEPLRPSTS